ncbi:MULTISPECIES: DUF2059 domain-containing protein [Myroides]|uniref:DUF2059 domain-containing protein n=1 Tax=Myroides albus TaxID=2562892 RepID=A0A6I3LM20_9FLAO|nr:MULTISPECIES: DUF2059 domain-containing protein [Myroides]MTG97035.1 DUF2059 domain-containing protein [Myroides albus]MVX36348.1 DUF2059 domain-containing protein [Myroides sp. LoEW2-1]UVD78541.1 DUF2059 domain-containing protein [Myroides albus]
MRKLLFTFVVIFASQVSFAQDFKTDTKKYMDMSGQLAIFEKLTSQLEENIPSDKRADFRKDLNASLNVLKDKMADLYMSEFTHQDVKDLIQFYETPLGKKLSTKSTILMEKGEKVGQEWAMGLQGIMMKYMQ